MSTFRQQLEKYQLANGQSLTNYKFVYHDKKILRNKSNTICCLFIIQSTNYGASLMEFKFRRNELKTPKSWSLFLKNKGIDIFITAVLPAINTKTGEDWVLKRFLGFGFKPGLRNEVINDIQQTSHTSTDRKRNKSVKKRKANVH